MENLLGVAYAEFKIGQTTPHGAPHPLGMVGRTQPACLKMINDHNINLINLVEG